MLDESRYFRALRHFAVPNPLLSDRGADALYYGLGIIFMLGGAVAAYVKRLQSRVSDQEKSLTEYKLYVAETF